MAPIMAKKADKKESFHPDRQSRSQGEPVQWLREVFEVSSGENPISSPVEFAEEVRVCVIAWVSFLVYVVKIFSAIGVKFKNREPRMIVESCQCMLKIR